MKTYYDLSDEEFLRYLRLLVAQLSRLPPYRWQQIAAIAGNPEEFIEIVQSMCNDRLFDWIDDFGNRCCFIDIKRRFSDQARSYVCTNLKNRN